MPSTKKLPSTIPAAREAAGLTPEADGERAADRSRRSPFLSAGLPPDQRGKADPGRGEEGGVETPDPPHPFCFSPNSAPAAYFQPSDRTRSGEGGE